jgi:hypothetical protein
MLVACRLAGLSALEAHYAGVDAYAQMLTTSRHCAGRASYSDVTSRPDKRAVSARKRTSAEGVGCARCPCACAGCTAAIDPDRRMIPTKSERMVRLLSVK